MFAVCRSHYLLSGRRKKAHTKAAGRKTKKRQGRGKKKRGVRRSKVGTGAPNQQEGPLLEGVGDSLARGDRVAPCHLVAFPSLALPSMAAKRPLPCQDTLLPSSCLVLSSCDQPWGWSGGGFTGVLESLRWCLEGLHSLALLCHRTKSLPAAALPAHWGSADRPVAPVSPLCTSPPGHPSA